jgi:hypothetical protein
MTDKQTQEQAIKGNMLKDPDQRTTGEEPMTGAQRSYLKTLSEEVGEPFDEHLTKARADEKDFYPISPSPLMTLLRLFSKLLPGDYLKTLFYLNLIEKPRRLLRLSLNTFYRMDHVYAVLKEFKHHYKGNFSILEFGTSDGYAFTKMLYATKYLNMADRVIVHTFDSF